MSEPITVEGDSKAVTITHHDSSPKIKHPTTGSTSIEIHSDPGSPFHSLVVKDDKGQVLFTAPDTGPGNMMWHVEIK